MKTPVTLVLGILIGLLSYVVYDYDRAVGQQIELSVIQGKVDAALSLCPAAFQNVVKQEDKKVK